MSYSPENPAAPATWLEQTGLLHIFRAVGFSLQPAKLGLALATLILTFLFGSLLDALWTVRGGIDEAAIDRFIASRELDQPFESCEGQAGVFQVWREHVQRTIFGLLGSSIPGASVAEGTPLGDYFAHHGARRPLRNLAAFACGAWWMWDQHTGFFLVFWTGCLLLWSLGGGAICRLAAMQFARDEKLTASQGLIYARRHLWNGFVLAPCVPLVFALMGAAALVAFGALLRFPLIGDVVGGALFPLAVLVGFVIATLLLGLLVGGHLMWPAVAAEGQDALDAFARGLNYAFTRAWKTVIYAIIALMLASLCWVFVNLFTYFALSISHELIAFGTSWWERGTPIEPANKLELLWALKGTSALYDWPDGSRFAWYEFISAFLVGVTVLLVIGLMFSFLLSFYFSSSTILYFLLRRDVDKVDLGEVFMDEVIGGDAERVAERVAAAKAADATKAD